MFNVVTYVYGANVAAVVHNVKTKLLHHGVSFFFIFQRVHDVHLTFVRAKLFCSFLMGPLPPFRRYRTHHGVRA